MVTKTAQRRVVRSVVFTALGVLIHVVSVRAAAPEEDAGEQYDDLEFGAEYATEDMRTAAGVSGIAESDDVAKREAISEDVTTKAEPKEKELASQLPELTESVSAVPERIEQETPTPTSGAGQGQDESSVAQPSDTSGAPETAPTVQETSDTEMGQPATQEATSLEALKEPEIGIDTRNLAEGQGNWLFKRIWWERAEQKYEKIRKYVESVFEARTLFLAQRADLDKNVLDPFYIAIGFGQTELKRIINSLMRYLDRVRTDKDGLLDHQQKILQELRKEENTFKKIKRAAEGIVTVNQQINDSLNTLLEQINRVRTYEREAWKHFKKIARVLSDTEARTLYYEMDIIAKNIVDIQGYISQDFAYYFGELDAMLKQLVAELQEAIESLKEKGIELHDQLEQLERKPEPCPIVPPEEPEEEKAEAGWFESYVLEPVSSIFSGIGSFFGYLYSLVAGGQDMVHEQSDENNTED